MEALEARDLILQPFGEVWLQEGYEGRYADIPGEAPKEDVVWARVNLNHISGNQSSLSNNNGKRRFDNTGILTLQIFSPMGDAAKTAYTVAQAVVNAYRDVKDGCVWFRNTYLKEIGASGGFYQVNVLTEFKYTDVR